MSRASRPVRSFAFAYLVRATVGTVISALFRTQIIGAENVPASGGVLLAGNHISYADPTLLWIRSPRPVHFMAKAELWDSAWLGWFLDCFWAFPVKRGESDRAALTRASAYLKAGEPVGVFPEGTRNRDGEAEAQGGAAFLALRNGVPVVPVGIAGTDRISPVGSKGIHFPKVVISFGLPIDPARVPEGGKKERVEALTAEIMRSIGEQLESAREVAGS
jgi:1-acyl-sn-glycerol-3-phosphate acyltransferase